MLQELLLNQLKLKECDQITQTHHNHSHRSKLSDKKGSE
jgi:hypothetical protein